MSKGSPISWGSSSISASPALLVRVLNIEGSRIKVFSLWIDQELSFGWGLSRKIDSLSCLKLGQVDKKWKNVSSSSSQNLHTLEMLGFILFWCLPRKLWPVMALTMIVRYPRDSRSMPLDLLGSGVCRNNFVCVWPCM